MEFKDFDINGAELKLDADSRVFTGYASTFGNVDSYGDTILPGAYKSVIAGDTMPVMFYGHDWSSIPIGKWLSMQEDEKGLLVTGQLTRGNTKADEVLAALRDGSVSGLSIGFSVSKDDYEEKADSAYGRTIKNISRLYEISVVALPADGFARVTEVRAEDIAGITTIRELEDFLRDSGRFSRSAAQGLIARCKSLFNAQRDAEAEGKAAQRLLERLKKLERSL